MEKSKEAFFPPLELKISEQSKTASVLYSTATSSIFGKGSRQEIYIDRSNLPTSIPTHIHIMVYLFAPPAPQEGRKVFALDLDRVYPGQAIRYQGDENGLGTVYFPAGMFSDVPPKKCFLEIEFR